MVGVAIGGEHHDETVPLSEILGEGEARSVALPTFTLSRRGYEPSQVDAYLREVLADLDDTKAQLEALRPKVADLEGEIDRHEALPAFAQLGEHIGALLNAAADEGDLIRRRAEEDAVATLARANAEGDVLRRTAADRLADADLQAADIVAGAEERRRAAAADAETMRFQAAQEVMRVRSQRDLGIVAIEELSRVLAKVADEARHEGPPGHADDLIDLDVEPSDGPPASPFHPRGVL